LFLLAALPAVAATIITQTATTNLGTLYAPVYAGWTQTSTYSGITITAMLASDDPADTATGTGYLVNSQPPTTVASQVGSPGTPFSTNNTTFSPITLFTGLTLGPGTYYVVISNGGDVLAQSSRPGSTTVTLGTGVTAGPDGVENGAENAYPPDTPFFIVSQKEELLFSVTGTPVVTPVPALSPWAMLATAILLAGSGLLFVRQFKPAA
jgi:hypothetical protein